jgi:hypothetical protein
MDNKYAIPHLSGVGKGAFVTPYWGPQKIAAFPDEVLSVFDAGDRYVDLTAGGGGMVFHRAKGGQPAHGNDRNPYAAAGFQAMEELQQQPLKDVFERYVAAWHPDNLKVVRGYLSERMSLPYRGMTRPNVNVAVAEYFDSLMCAGSVASYCAARVLLGTFSFRQLSWDRRTSDEVPIPCTEVTVETVRRKVGRQLFKLISAVEQLKAPVTGSFGDATQTPLRTGDVVYSDPAWPWGPNENTTKDNSNPYVFLTTGVGSIMTQREIPQKSIAFWTPKDAEQIYADVVSWIRYAFDNNARAFVISTQGTNFPVPTELYPELSRRLCLRVEVLHSNARSEAMAKPFTEWFGIFHP